MRTIVLAGLMALGLGLGGAASSEAAQLPGLGSLAGKVSAPASVGQLSVYAMNTDKGVGYQVFVVDGVYRATNLIPGHYDVTLRGTVGQRSWGVTPQTTQIRIAANQAATLDLTLRDTKVKPVYAGGLTYEGWSDLPYDEPKPVAVPVPYEKLYPPGRARELIEGICMGCHTVSFLPYGVPRTHPDGRAVHDRAGWAITVDRMLARKTYSDGSPLKITKAEREQLIDYLDKNFGADAVPRAVLQERDPPLDKAALAKAQFIEYRLLNSKDFPTRSTHHVSFNPDGSVWTFDRGSNGPGRGLIWIDPDTGDKEFYPDDGEGEPVVAEWVSADIDGSAWYAGLRHFDRATGRLDIYNNAGPNGGTPLWVSTGIFDSNGDMWFTGFGAGISKWIRNEDRIVRWEVPLYRAAPYGIALDSQDRVWFAEGGNDGVGVFDPKTQKFRHYPLVTDDPFAFQFRRLGVDRHDMVWAAAWASRGMQNSKLYRVNPETAEVKGWKIPVEYSNPYDTAPDWNNRIWIATDNHVAMFDPTSQKFTLYPTPARTDIPRLTLTAQGSIWFAPRNAGQSGGYGASASVLYPDKDKIQTLRATYDPRGYFGRQLTAYKGGKVVKPEGRIKQVDPTPQNPGAYARLIKSMSLSESEHEGGKPKTGIEGIN